MLAVTVASQRCTHTQLYICVAPALRLVLRYCSFTAEPSETTSPLTSLLVLTFLGCCQQVEVLSVNSTLLCSASAVFLAPTTRHPTCLCSSACGYPCFWSCGFAQEAVKDLVREVVPHEHVRLPDTAFACDRGPICWFEMPPSAFESCKSGDE